MSTRKGVPVRRSRLSIERRLRSAEVQVDRLLRAIKSLRKSVAVVDAPGRRKARRSAHDVSRKSSPKPTLELLDVLAKVLKGRTLGAKEAAERVKKAGFRSSTRGFIGVVRRVLSSSAKFRAVGPDLFTVRTAKKAEQ
jgi:hypothetical protein